MTEGISPIGSIRRHAAGCGGQTRARDAVSGAACAAAGDGELCEGAQRFYGLRALRDVSPETIKDLSVIEKLPMTSQADIRAHGEEMLCIERSGIEKNVTMQTSGRA